MIFGGKLLDSEVLQKLQGNFVKFLISSFLGR